MNFAQKTTSVRTSVTDTNNSINNTDVYNELMLEALQSLAPASANQNLETQVFNVGAATIPAGYYSVCLILNSAFTGTVQGAAFEAGTIINLTAKNVLGVINFEVLTGTITAIKLTN
jgi:hypothetical protein